MKEDRGVISEKGNRDKKIVMKKQRIVGDPVREGKAGKNFSHFCGERGKDSLTVSRKCTGDG